jgi:uncharacterized protein YecE (DUF72 family)
MRLKSLKLYIGTSGWSYKHWTEIFYPKDIKPDKYLEFYTSKFTCVELNSSFYNLPLKTTVTGWMNRTPDAFKFCPKLSRLITHQLLLVNIEGALKKYFDVFEGLKKKLGPVLIQLPPGLSYDKSMICNFFDLLKERYSEFRFVIEVRNKSWIDDSFFDLLSKYGIAFVIADSGGRFPHYETVTSGFIYLRFHGCEQLYASDYSETDLRLNAEKIINWLDEGKETWVFFNNDYHGFAVKNAERLRELIDML